MLRTRHDFRALKRTVSIEAVLADHGLLDGLRRRRLQLVGPCPLHGGDNTTAFVVNTQRNIWRCFTGCDDGGDVIDLVRRLRAASYVEAASYLARLPGTIPPSVPVQTAKRPFRPFTRRLRLDPAAPFLTHKGIRPITAARFDAGAFQGPGMLAGCVAVRLFDPDGRPLGYAGRRLDCEQARIRGKWVFPPGFPKHRLLYGYHQAHKLNRPGLVLVECPWGVLRFAQLGIPAVGLLGTHLSPKQQALLESFQPPIVLLMDGDQAGRSASHRIKQQLLRSIAVALPEGLDPDDLCDRALIKAADCLPS